MFCNEFQIVKTTFLTLILDKRFLFLSLNSLNNFRYQILTLQNQNAADEK